MATAQRKRPRVVVGAPCRTAWQLKSASRNDVSAARRTMMFLFFFRLLLVSYFLCTTIVSHDVTIL